MTASGPVTVEFDCRHDDYRAWLGFWLPRSIETTSAHARIRNTRAAVLGYAILAALLAGVGVLFMWNEAKMLGGIVLIGDALLCSALFKTYAAYGKSALLRSQTSSYSEAAPLDDHVFGPRKVTLDDSGLRVQCRAYDVLVPWNGFEAVRESPTHIAFLRRSRLGGFDIVPKSAFDRAEHATAFVEFARQRISASAAE